MKIVKGILAIICIFILILGGYFLYMTVTDYKPEDIIQLKAENNTQRILSKNMEISAMIFNIGYCGLDKKQDFFMDGGTGSRAESKEKVFENLNQITTFIKNKDVDFLLLQEVDEKATRSYNINQFEHIKNVLDSYNATFCVNYKVPWVPVPITKPHGKVESGLATFSKYKVDKVTRFKLPGEEKWPRRLALLDRCFLESRVPIEDGSELILLNVHLSAYDKGGIIRRQQLGFLKEYIKNEYEKGNYIVVGGDWNHLVPGADLDIFGNKDEWPEWLQKIPDDFKSENFSFELDKNVATHRSLDSSYEKGNNYLSIIDGYLVSKNINVLETMGEKLEFKNSDHNPVSIKFTLK
ncbi:endonuclease/exonuclease/phosphatase family protein [Clostridiaceae bacterium M8S5]|nr:endonuclease/exonuclease/phosphatase family protein [Clostridiaceae bacterium M8S5]